MSDRSRWLALYVLCSGMLMIVLDATIVNVALPDIQTSLHLATGDLAWVVNAYLIAFGGLLLLAGRLGDLLGRRRIFLIGLAVFTAASALCGLATSSGLLIAARFVQGGGGALTSSVILGMIVTLFPQPREQAKAIGVFAFVASAGGAVGLLAGGVLTQLINWHWIFFVNLPIGVLAAVLTVRLVPGEPGIGWSAGADLPGAALITSALMVCVFTIVKPAAEQGWTARPTVLFGLVALVLFGGFVARQATAARPMMPLRVLRSRNLLGANLIQVVGAAGMYGVSFLGALFVQRVLGYSPLEIGLAFLPVTVLMGALSVRYSERLITRFGARPLVITGLVLIALGLGWFARAGVDSGYVTAILPSMVLIGIGAGLCFPPLMGLAMSGATPADAGLASGLINTTGQVGGALGLAVLATIAAGRSATLTRAGRSGAAALTGGYQLAFGVAAGLALLAVAIAGLVLRAEAAAAESPEPAADPRSGAEVAANSV